MSIGALQVKPGRVSCYPARPVESATPDLFQITRPLLCLWNWEVSSRNHVAQRLLTLILFPLYFFAHFSCSICSWPLLWTTLTIWREIRPFWAPIILTSLFEFGRNTIQVRLGEFIIQKCMTCSKIWTLLWGSDPNVPTDWLTRDSFEWICHLIRREKSTLQPLYLH